MGRTLEVLDVVLGGIGVAGQRSSDLGDVTRREAGDNVDPKPASLCAPASRRKAPHAWRRGHRRRTMYFLRIFVLSVIRTPSESYTPVRKLKTMSEMKYMSTKSSTHQSPSPISASMSNPMRSGTMMATYSRRKDWQKSQTLRNLPSGWMNQTFSPCCFAVQPIPIMARSSRCASSAASVASRPTAPNVRRQLLRTESAGSAPALPTVQAAGAGLAAHGSVAPHPRSPPSWQPSRTPLSTGLASQALCTAPPQASAQRARRAVLSRRPRRSNCGSFTSCAARHCQPSLLARTRPGGAERPAAAR